MSISRLRNLRKSRGFAADAAFVLAVLLTGVALAVHATAPIQIAPTSSQTAAVSGVLAADTRDLVPVASASSDTTTTTVVCRPGMNYSLSVDKDTGRITKQEIQICPPTNSGPEKEGRALVECKDGKSADGPKANCRYVPQGSLQPYKLASPWTCRTRVIDEKGTTSGEKCYVRNHPEGSGSVDVPKPNNGNTYSTTDATPPSSTLSTPLGDRTLQELLTGQENLTSTVAGCGATNSAECTQARTDLESYNKALADLAGQNDNLIGTCYQQGSTCTPDQTRAIDDNKAIDEALARNATGICPTGQSYNATNGQCGASTTQPPPCTGSNCSTQPPPGGGQPPPGGGQPPPGGGQSPPGQGGPGGGGGQPFGNPALGAGNQPQSPFGGSCTPGYVCQGNTLYYQTVAQGYGGGQGQCMTQPYQQCPYGCQQPYGAGATQQNSTMSGIMGGLQIVSALTSMFGGGSSAGGTAVANPNQSRSCAMSPQQQSPYGTGTNGQACSQPPQQPNPSQCSSGQWKPISASGNGCTTGYQCVPNGGNAPTAQLSCQPKIADSGQAVSISYACANATGSTGTGFSTNGALSGSLTVDAPTPPAGQNTVTYTLTCLNQGVTSSAQCQVQLGKPGIVLVTNPKAVHGGETSLIGWISSGMQSCVISSPDQSDFTQRNANNTNPNGAATSSPITGTTRFQLDCTTLGGVTKQATTTVTMN